MRHLISAANKLGGPGLALALLLVAAVTRPTVRFVAILLKNSKMHSLHFLAKLNRDRQFGL